MIKVSTPAISPADLRQLIDYDPLTGLMKWRHRTVGPFCSGKKLAAWNSRYAGQPALTTKTPYGYYCGGVAYEQFLAHRVAWAIHHGEWPSTEIDHINGDGRDNRISNLRLADRTINLRNCGIRRDNTSGRTGVQFLTRENKWYATIKANKIRISLGYFDTFDEAVTARERAEAEHEFTANGRRNRTEAT